MFGETPPSLLKLLNSLAKFYFIFIYLLFCFLFIFYSFLAFIYLIEAKTKRNVKTEHQVTVTVKGVPWLVVYRLSNDISIGFYVVVLH